jgi:hypothetical protein
MPALRNVLQPWGISSMPVADSSNDLYPGYVNKVLSWYIDLPDTPPRPSRYDRALAIELCRRQIPLAVLDTAFLLATGRRHLRNPSLPQLASIRSLHYFLPVVEEVLASPLTTTYTDHLRHKLRRLNLYR